MLKLSSMGAGAAILVGGLLAGCAVHPLDCPVDATHVESGWVRPATKVRRVIVASDVAIYTEDGSDRAVLNTDRVQERVRAVTEKELTAVPGFEPVNLDNAEDADKINIVGGKMDEIGAIPGIDYILQAKSSTSYLAKPGKVERMARKAKGIGVETMYTLYDVSTKKSVFAETFNDAACGDVEGEVKKCIDSVTAANAKALRNYLVRMYVTRDLDIKECRGSGRFVLIDAPSAAKSLLKPGVAITFYEKRKNGDGWRDAEVASGKVMDEPVQGSAYWVEVENFETAGVQRGHFAKLAE